MDRVKLNTCMLATSLALVSSTTIPPTSLSLLIFVFLVVKSFPGWLQKLETINYFNIQVGILSIPVPVLFVDELYRQEMRI